MGALALEVEAPKKLFSIKDQIGNTRVVVSHTGVIKEQNNFLPYGEKINDANFASGNNDYFYGEGARERILNYEESRSKKYKKEIKEYGIHKRP